jgi:hypothetical protein
VEEQLQILTHHSIGVAVGSSNRVNKLLEGEKPALDLSRLKLLIVDCAVDTKNYNILNQPELARDLFNLYDHHIKAIQGIKIAFV